MASRTLLSCLCPMLSIAIMAGCGGKTAEERRVETLAANPSASFKAYCGEFLAEVGKKTDWPTAGVPETKVRPATKEDAGDAYEDGAQLGLLRVKLTDKEKKETTFGFVFVSIPTYGTWQLLKVGSGNADKGTFGPYEGDTDAFHKISAELGKHRP